MELSQYGKSVPSVFQSACVRCVPWSWGMSSGSLIFDRSHVTLLKLYFHEEILQADWMLDDVIQSWLM